MLRKILIGAAMLGIGAAAASALRRRPGRAWLPPSRASRTAARALDVAASGLAGSVLLDSTLEHYRGGFYRPMMYVPPVVSAAQILSCALSLARGRRGGGGAAVGIAAAAVGVVGGGFHLHNVRRRVGGLSLENVFYGAPLLAPFGLVLAGLASAAAVRLRAPRRLASTPRLLGLPAGQAVAAGAALGLVGTSVEAGYLHFRGAFQDPFMFVPISVPPVAAAALALAAVRPRRAVLAAARALLRLTVWVGVVGVGFHALGVARNMGGFRNWTQNIQSGPPLPAPPSFSTIAMLGLGALPLLEEARA